MAWTIWVYIKTSSVAVVRTLKQERPSLFSSAALFLLLPPVDLLLAFYGAPLFLGVPGALFVPVKRENY